MLTERARQYLATLERIRPVPTKEVERVLREQGSPCFDTWLKFHEEYAGYVEPIGAERAIWGIVHEKSRWIPPGRAAVEKSKTIHANWFVTCAEVHGSYVYQLADTGLFRERSAETFDIKVERNAVWVAFARAPGPRARFCTNLSQPAFVDRVRKETSVAPEASDQFYRVLVGKDVLAVEDAKTGALVDGLTRDAA